MADDIDTSAPQNPDDVYAWVQYPGPYRISTTEGGDLLVVGNHSWTKDGVGLKKAQLYRFDGETGTLKWKWPPNQTLPMTISWFDYSRDAKTVALLTYIRGSGEAGGFKSGTLYVINGETGEAAWEYTFDPLKPYFEEVTFWRGVSASPDGGFINVTTDDGRAFIFNTTPKSEGIKPLWNANLTTPLEVSGIPIIATNGTIAATNDFALFVTGDTFIPYHLQKGAQRPPSAHPNGMTLFAYAWSGRRCGSGRWKVCRRVCKLMGPDGMPLSACPSAEETLRNSFTASLSLISPRREAVSLSISTLIAQRDSSPTIPSTSARADGSSPSSKCRSQCPMRQPEAEIGCISFDRLPTSHIIHLSCFLTVLSAAFDFSP